MKLHEAMLLVTSEWCKNKEAGLCRQVFITFPEDKQCHLRAALSDYIFEVFGRDSLGIWYWGVSPKDVKWDPNARILGGCLLAHLIEEGEIEAIMKSNKKWRNR